VPSLLTVITNIVVGAYRPPPPPIGDGGTPPVSRLGIPVYYSVWCSQQHREYHHAVRTAVASPSLTSGLLSRAWLPDIARIRPRRRTADLSLEPLRRAPLLSAMTTSYRTRYTKRTPRPRLSSCNTRQAHNFTRNSFIKAHHSSNMSVNRTRTVLRIRYSKACRSRTTHRICNNRIPYMRIMCA